MNFSLFYHSLVSDWNHGNAHFLRGVVDELLAHGHRVEVFEPARGWSRENLLREQGEEALRQFHSTYPCQSSVLYERGSLDLEMVAAQSDVVIVHEWNDDWLVNELGLLHNRLQQRGARNFTLLFHDTHHRLISAPASIGRFRLDCYDGILAFGEVLSETYRRHGWSSNVWTWHEAADTRRFLPQPADPERTRGDVVWVGNWGDDERSRELDEFLFRPVRDLGLSCDIYGVRYPEDVLAQLGLHGINHRGWLANFKVPQVFANHAATVHVPRRYSANLLPGIPTIRPFEAMACAIPLVSSPWHDSENLFTAGKDYLVAKDADDMRRHLRAILNDADFARELAANGLATIRARHTCAHRIEQLLHILQDELAVANDEPSRPPSQPQQNQTSTGRSKHATG